MPLASPCFCLLSSRTKIPQGSRVTAAKVRSAAEEALSDDEAEAKSP